MTTKSNPQNPLVSIIIPAYNHKNYIALALKTACRQNYSPIEVIVIDDGSTDGTRDILRMLQEEYDFLYIENKKNMGLTKSLNTALNHAHGKYFSLLAGDDYWTLNKISIQVIFMEQNPEVAACTGKITTIDSDGNPYKKYFAPKNKKVIYYSLTDFMEYDFVFPAMVVMIRKNIMTEIDGYDERFIMEDFPLWLKLSSLGWKLAMLPDLLGFYRLHGTNLHKNVKQMFENHLKLLHEYKDYPGYKKGIRAVYARQIEFGPTTGYSFWFKCIIFGFSFRWSYFKSYGQLIRSWIRSLLKKITAMQRS